jgi:hemerythrin-like domain-containing protein
VIWRAIDGLTFHAQPLELFLVTIIEGLVAEHRVFLTIFDQIERSLPDIKTLDEIKLVCRLVEGLLHNHGMAETDLAYITFDHMLKEQNRCTRLNHDHQEIDVLLREVETIKDLPEARARLKASLNACRNHFNEEERNVFPLIEKTLQHETLVVLGKAWRSQSYLTPPPAERERPGSSKKKT